MVKKIFLILIFTCLTFSAGWFSKSLLSDKNTVKNPVAETIQSATRPLGKYSIENLQKADIKPGKITIKEKVETNQESKTERRYDTYIFEFEFSPDLSGKTKKTTGQINMPKLTGVDALEKMPLVLMFRGYIDQTIYKTGDGTRRGAEFFANNGFITFAPDFLGYGGSDKEAGNIFESRFQTYVTALSLLRSIENTNVLDIGNLKFGIGNLFIWAHSNGGQIALTLLETTGVNYPTVLWAPVSKPFPYSILYYTDDSEDHGKFIRKELSDFEEDRNK